MTDEKIWKQRFILISLVRLAGTVLGLLGLAIAFGDLIEPGGNIALGLPLAIVGLIDIALVPRMLSRGWRRP